MRSLALCALWLGLRAVQGFWESDGAGGMKWTPDPMPSTPPVCTGRWPSVARVSGGERVLVTLRNLPIPWYVRAQQDIYPHTKWRKNDGSQGWEDPLKKPIFSFESSMASAVIPDSAVTFLNTTLESLDFRRYQYMEPEENERLIRKHGNDLLAEFIAPDMGIRFGYTQVLYVFFRGSKTALSGCNIFCHAKPVSDWILPESSPAIGGELITVGGMNLMGSAELQQLIRFDDNGVLIHVPVESTSPSRLTFRSPPALLNETDAEMTMTMHFTLNTQVWYAIPFKLAYTDRSRHSCGMAIAITNFEALHFNRPHNTLVALPGATYPFPGSGKGVVAVEDAKTHKCDAGRMWVLREAHNQTRCMPGTPILCGQIVRLQNMITHANLQSGFVESPAVRQQEVSYHGKAGHDSTMDNWQIQCEPATEHGYAPNWKSFTIDKTLHKNRFLFRMKHKDKYFRPSTIFRLYHPGTKKYLNFVDVKLPAKVCGRACAGKNLKVAAALEYRHELDKVPFKIDLPDAHPNCDVDLSLELHNDTSQRHCAGNGHSAMAGLASGHRDGVRFFTKFYDMIAFEDNLNREVALRRMLRHQRRIQPQDFVAWRSKSSVPCEGKGDTLVGIVHELSETSRTVMVEEWILYRGYYTETPRFTQSLVRTNWTLPMERVYGPLLNQRMWFEYTSKPGAAIVRVNREFLNEHQAVQFQDRGGDLAHLATSSGDMYVEA